VELGWVVLPEPVLESEILISGIWSLVTPSIYPPPPPGEALEGYLERIN
jgi:hypothetical protein